MFDDIKERGKKDEKEIGGGNNYPVERVMTINWFCDRYWVLLSTALLRNSASGVVVIIVA